MSGLLNSTFNVDFTGKMMIDGLLYWSAWAGTTISYAFPTIGADYAYGPEATSNFTAANAAQQAAVLFALERGDGNSANNGFSIEGFTATGFAAGASDSAILRVAMSDSVAPYSIGYAPGDAASSGDVWLSHDAAYQNPTAGTFGWYAILHEIGSALGLKAGYSTDGAGALPTAYDTIEFTVMTNRAHVGAAIGSGPYEADGAPQSFMIGDIAALQTLYGANYTVNRSATVYAWTPGSGMTKVNGEAAITPSANRIFLTIWDGGGIDTYDMSAYRTAMNIDLRPGHGSVLSDAQLARLSAVTRATANVYNALLHDGDWRSLIENAVGGDGGDIMVGNLANNRLNGGAGADTLSGLAGADVLTGGTGADHFIIGRHGGHDRITDFTPSRDRIDLSATQFDSYRELETHIRDIRDAVIIDLGPQASLYLGQVEASQLHASSFLF